MHTQNTEIPTQPAHKLVAKKIIFFSGWSCHKQLFCSSGLGTQLQNCCSKNYVTMQTIIKIIKNSLTPKLVTKKRKNVCGGRGMKRLFPVVYLKKAGSHKFYYVKCTQLCTFPFTIPCIVHNLACKLSSKILKLNFFLSHGAHTTLRPSKMHIES